VQIKTCDEIDRQVQGLSELTSRIDESIDRLREFRSALITAAVTGQIDMATWGRRGTTDRRLEAIEETLGAEREEAAV
jgi:type I restriction enzyme S subunit